MQLLEGEWLLLRCGRYQKKVVNGKLVTKRYLNALFTPAWTYTFASRPGNFYPAFDQYVHSLAGWLLCHRLSIARSFKNMHLSGYAATRLTLCAFPMRSGYDSACKNAEKPARKISEGQTPTYVYAGTLPLRASATSVPVSPFQQRKTRSGSGERQDSPWPTWLFP